MSIDQATTYTQGPDRWSVQFWTNGQWVAVIVLLLLTTAALMVHYRNTAPLIEVQSYPTIFRYKGNVHPNEVLLIYLVTGVDVLVRLSPITGDPDLLAATGENQKILVNRLAEPHRSQCMLNKPVYRFNAPWDQLINPHTPDDVYQLFLHQSASLGTEELVIRSTRSTDASVRQPQPILIAVRPYPHVANDCVFQLEVFPYQPIFAEYDELQRWSEQAELTYEQLTLQFATVLQTSELETAEPTVQDSPTVPNSRVDTFKQTVKHSRDTFSLLFFAILEGLFEAIV